MHKFIDFVGVDSAELLEATLWPVRVSRPFVHQLNGGFLDLDGPFFVRFRGYLL